MTTPQGKDRQEFSVLLNSLITSKTRIKLLHKFFLNSNTSDYLRNMEQEFGESTNAIRVELNKMEEAGLLDAEITGNRKYFRANTNHPFFTDINNMLKKTVGIDLLIKKVTNKLNGLESAYITGDLAKGLDTEIIDLVLVGQDLDTKNINRLITKTEKKLAKKIRYLNLTARQMSEYFKNKPALLIWNAD